MSVLAHCDCGKKYKIDLQFAGRTIKCPNCGGGIDVPGETRNPGPGSRPSSRRSGTPETVEDEHVEREEDPDLIQDPDAKPDLVEKPDSSPEEAGDRTPAPETASAERTDGSPTTDDASSEPDVTDGTERTGPDTSDESPGSPGNEQPKETVRVKEKKTKTETDAPASSEPEKPEPEPEQRQKSEEEETNKKETARSVGIDIGTENLVVASHGEDGGVEITNQRNAFIEVPSDDYTLEMIRKRNISHASKDDNFYIIGNDAFELAQIFDRNPQRPMQQGVLSPDETDAIPILSMFLEKLVGEPDENSKAVFSIPADPIDTDFDAKFHESIFIEILDDIGFESSSLYEGHAAVLSELGDENFTGVAASFGAGMTNCCIAYESIPAIVLSTSRGGRWIDRRAAKVSGVNQSRVTAIKEGGMNLMEPEGRVEKAIAIYYEELLNWTVRNIAKQFKQADDVPEFKDPISFVATGGTVKVKGFAAKFMQAVEDIGFPIKIDDYRVAENPLTSVCRGCLVSVEI